MTYAYPDLFINGKPVRPTTGETMPVYAPSTGEVVSTIACGNAQDMDAAVAAARAAFEGTWGRLPPVEKGRLLSRLARRILEVSEELALIEALDTGKPMTQARADITAVARYFEFYGGAADKIHGDVIPYDARYHVAVLKEPYGVTGHILPWNYPAQMYGRSLAPSLAAGNAVVLKPAEEACMSILRLTELAAEVGFPAGAINVVPGRGEEAGAALSANAGIDFLSFTGSPEVGTLVQKAAAENHIGCVLELGGKSPQLVFADAEFDKVVPTVIRAIVQNAGQTCSAGSRVLVEGAAYNELVARIADSFGKIRVGSHAMDLDCGPLISAAQRDRVQGFVDRAEKDGVPVLAQGQLAANLPAGGYYVAPRLYGPVPRGNSLAREEVFGPVLSILPFDGEDDAVRLANGTDFGLISSVWTRDGARQMRVARAMHCGQVFVNNYGAGGGVELPFGGVKKSGHGREKGFAAVDEFCTTKTIVIDHG